MNEGMHINQAARDVAIAMSRLAFAKSHLRHAKSDQLVRLGVALAQLEEIHDILMDPECTPEILEVDRDYSHPEFDDCVWDGNRIDATKTVLFHEFIASERGGSR